MNLTTQVDSHGIVHAASFRDPSGFMFFNGQGQLLRQVNQRYYSNYRQLIDSGLHDELVGNGLMVRQLYLLGQQI